jgi:uncharacterized protein YndB with AHSA1/START domain
MSTQIEWPARFAPPNCPIHVRNELAIAASPERVWAWLVRAQGWPRWYVNASDVRFLAGAPPDLAAGTRFRWRTFGVRIESTVREWAPPHRLAWDAHSFGVEAYHAWLITPTADGCHVLTEETQHGFLARLGALVMPRRMGRYHQIWLEGLRGRALAGPPGG